jgi:hypothetical protein
MELEWILLHGGDSLPRSLPISWARSGFSMSQPLKVLPLLVAHLAVRG